MTVKSCALLLIPTAWALSFAPQILSEPSLPAIYAGYADAGKKGTLPKTAPLSEQSAGAVEQVKVDWQSVFVKFFPQEAGRLEKFNTVWAVTWASGNFDFDPTREVLVSVTVKQSVSSYSDAEFPIAPAYQIVFVAELDGRGIRRDSAVPLVLNVTRDTDPDCGNCTGLQTTFALVATPDYNNDGTLEVVLQKETMFREATAVLDETQLYARVAQGWVPIRQDEPVLTEREGSD
jgi:hypothetical protein